MIRFVVVDLKSPVYLFQQQYPEQLVGEGHPGKREMPVRLPGDIRMEAVGTADDEGQAAFSGEGIGIDFFCKINGIHLPAVYFHRNQHVSRVDMLLNPFPFPGQGQVNLMGTGLGWNGLIGHLHVFQPAKTAEALGILIHSLDPVALLQLADGDDPDPHRRRPLTVREAVHGQHTDDQGDDKDHRTDAVPGFNGLMFFHRCVFFL